MTIWQERSFTEIPYVAQAILENDVKLMIRDDCTADGSDGKTYYNIFEDDGDMLIPIGWTTKD